MGKYTAYNQPWVDEQIKRQLDLAVDIIEKRIKNISSIILVGGFGRGEGSVKLENEKMIPLNDYDIYVVLKDNFKISESENQELTKEIEEKAETSGFSLYEKSEKSFYFDIRFLNLNQLTKLSPFIKYYEMKHASYVLFGEDIRNLIPDYKPQDLPVSEGLRFILNRLSSISLWGPVDLILKKDLPQWQKDALLYDISKSYIEICTCLTQLAGVYQPTYQKRLEELKKVFDQEFIDLKNQTPDLLEKIDYYTQLKLKSEYEGIDNYLERWFEARDDLLRAIKFVLKESFSINSFDQFLSRTSRKYFKPYLKIILKNRFKIENKFVLSLANFFSQAYLSLIWFLRVYQFRGKIHWPILFDLRDPGMKIYNSLLFITSSINQEGGIDKKAIKKGIRLLEKAYPVKKKKNIDINNFQEIIDAYIDAWKLYFFQKIG